MRKDLSHYLNIDSQAFRSHDAPVQNFCRAFGGTRENPYDLTMDPLSLHRRLENLYFRPHDPTDFVMSGPFGFPFPILRCTSFKPVSGRRRHKRKSLRSYDGPFISASAALSFSFTILRQTECRGIVFHIAPSSDHPTRKIVASGGEFFCVAISRQGHLRIIGELQISSPDDAMRLKS